MAFAGGITKKPFSFFYTFGFYNMWKCQKDDFDHWQHEGHPFAGHTTQQRVMF